MGDEIASLEALSHVLIDAGEHAESRAVALQTAAMIRASHAGRNHLPGVAIALARTEALRGRHDRALALIGSVRAIASDLPTHPVLLPPLEAVEAACRAALDETSAARAIARGEAMDLDSLFDYLDTEFPSVNGG